MKIRSLCAVAVLLLLLTACALAPKLPASEAPISQLPATEAPTTQPPTTAPPTTEPPTTEPPATEPEETRPEHSSFYIPGVSQEDVLSYFTEVCLDSEIVNSGDPTVIQKWVMPICYTLEGTYTQEDLEVLKTVENWLNNLEGFPGISRTEDAEQRNLRFCFCTEQEMLDLMGEEFRGTDGCVTFWYDWNNEIYEAIVCCRNDIDQIVRNSVIIEEIYNSLGPIQDTAIRPDSIIYQEYTFPQWMSDVDELILQLLYHPEMLPGMNAGQCEWVIREYYY